MIKRVLVYTYGDQSHRHSIGAAARLAANNGATLTGLFVKPDFAAYASVYGNYSLDLTQPFRDLQKEYATTAKSDFDEIVEEFDIGSQWHEVEQFETTPKPSNYADIIFVSQPKPKSTVNFNDTDFVDALITDTGLPTIVIPHGWSANTFAKSPVLGWKECREAVGAVRHALPLMRKADNVDIVSVRKATDLNEELIEGIEISEYLTEHQVKTEYFTVRMDAGDRRAADTLLRHVKDRGRDLIIIGGYSHSRIREVILGGMTRDLVKNSTVPVLLSH